MTEATKTIERGESVWTHDTVFITPDARRASDVPSHLLVLFAVFAALALVPWSPSWVDSRRVQTTLMAGGTLIGSIIWNAWGAWQRRTIRLRWNSQEMDALASTSPEARARACWLSGLRNRRGLFDVAQWLDAVGTDGPRVVAIGVTLPPMPWRGDESEEVPFARTGRRSVGQRRIGWMMLAYALLSTVIFVALNVLPLPAPMLQFKWLMLGGAVYFTLIGLWSLGRLRSPVAMNVLGPGRLVIGGVVGERTFERHDSVVVLLGRATRLNERPALLVEVVSRAGGVTRLHMDGPDDPHLAILLSRWCYRPMTSASPPSESPQSVKPQDVQQ